MSDGTMLEIICTVEGTVSVKAFMEFAEEEELRTILNDPSVRSKLAGVINEVLEFSEERLNRSSKNDLGWSPDGNRQAYVTEVAVAGVAVQKIDVYPCL